MPTHHTHSFLVCGCWGNDGKVLDDFLGVLGLSGSRFSAASTTEETGSEIISLEDYILAVDFI